MFVISILGVSKSPTEEKSLVLTDSALPSLEGFFYPFGAKI